MTDSLNSLINADCALYEIPSKDKESLLKRYIASTESSRAICNDPFIVGVDYTRKLQKCCTEVLSAWSKTIDAKKAPLEMESVVVHLLRGGLNFGLREALTDAFSWNQHSAAFMSAQRVQEENGNWLITETGYSKISLPPVATVFMGDVIATGTSARFALQQLCSHAKAAGSQIRQLVFFTIGGDLSEDLLEEVNVLFQESFPLYEGISLIYLEGRFLVAQEDSPLSIKIAGTDLLRGGALLAPEFLESQYQSFTYPLERCSIYDAGSRAFWIPEYFEDLKEYWENCRELAISGTSYETLLAQRAPELEIDRFKNSSGEFPDLNTLCERQLARIITSKDS